MSALESALPSGSVVSLGSTRRRSGKFQDKVAAVKDTEGLYDMVASLARGMDNLRTEVADNTRSVDAIAHDLKDIKTLLQELVNGRR